MAQPAVPGAALGAADGRMAAAPGSGNMQFGDAGAQPGFGDFSGSGQLSTGISSVPPSSGPDPFAGLGF